MPKRMTQIVSQWRTFDTWVGFLGALILTGSAFALLGGARYGQVAKQVVPAVCYAIIGTIVYFLVVEVAVPLITAKRQYPIFPVDHVKDWSVWQIIAIGFFANFGGLLSMGMAALVLIFGLTATNPTTAALIIDALLKWGGATP